MPIGIPNARNDPPPPPLPPPRYIDDFAAGSDPGWAWANDPSGGGFGKPKETSMAVGSNFPKSWDSIKTEDSEHSERIDYGRRELPKSTVGSPSEMDRRRDFAKHQDEGYYSLSGPSAMSQQSV